jgi:hypothetical protein
MFTFYALSAAYITRFVVNVFAVSEGTTWN